MTSKWNHLYFFSIFLTLLLAFTMPSYLAGQTTVNFSQYGGVPDHVGITFAGCSPSSPSMDCSYTQPVTCSTVAGSDQYTISGYTPSSADIGKHLIIGMPYGINGSTSFVGAGGNSYYGQPLRVLVQSVSGNTITGAVLTNGSTSANAVNSVTNAECDLETDNGPALQALVSAGDNVEIPAGNWGFDSAVLITANNIHITCEPGAVLYDARDDNYYNTGSAGSIYFQRKLFSWEGVSGGGMSGCTYLGTNVAVLVNPSIPGAEDEPNGNQAIYVHNSTGLTFQNLVGMNMWGDAFVTFGGNENYPTNGMEGTTYSTAMNIFTKNGWSYGLAITFGNNNTFQNIITRNDGPDIEPNDAAEADLTYGNSYTNVVSIDAANPDNGSMFWSSGDNSFCRASSACNGGQSVINSFIEGAFTVFPTCTATSPYTITGTWDNILLENNPSGSPKCGCGTDCSAK